ncbi:MAG: response regulator, partial [Sphingopyxis sp.]|nr:response regulator [Sphingopyxis sp.]
MMTDLPRTARYSLPLLALAQAQKEVTHNEALVLLDAMMPGLDGPATLARFRERAELARIPVVFITAKTLPAELQRFRALGAADVISKPFDP